MIKGGGGKATPPTCQEFFVARRCYLSTLIDAANVTAQANQDVVSRLPETTSAEFDAAVAAAKAAFPAWRRTAVSQRARVMLKLQQLIRENMVRAGAGS